MPLEKEATNGQIVQYMTSKLVFLVVLITAAVWCGRIYKAHMHLVTINLRRLNSLKTKRDPKWRTAKTPYDLTRLKEHEFLQMLAVLSIIGKNVKDELEACLKLRNACGHPNSLVVGEYKTTAHVETLIQNVFAKF